MKCPYSLACYVFPNILTVFQVSQLSVSGLLIWKSHRKGDRHVRILFVAPNAHQHRILTALEALHLGLPCIRSADPEAAFSNAASIGNGLGGARKPNSVAAGARATRPSPASIKSAGPAARVPSATSKPGSARNATTAAHTTAKLTKPAPKMKEPTKSTGQKTKTLKPEPPKEAPKAAVKVEKKKDEVEEKDEVFTPEPVPVPPGQLGSY